MSCCVDIYDSAQDQCHCYFWERKLFAIILLGGLWVAIFYSVNSSLSYVMAIWLGAVVSFILALCFYGITSDSYCGDPFKVCHTEKILPYVVKPVNNDHMYT